MIFILSSSVAFSQTVKKKKKEILVDGVVCLTLERDMAANMIILKDQAGNETIRIRHKKRNTLQGEDMYQLISFVESGQTFTTTSYIYTAAKLVERLAKNGAYSNCALVEDKIADFVTKYDEGVE